MHLFGLLFSILISSVAWAYPNFISYGYKSCLTCHYNGNGGGSLNDYGRAVFASELTSRKFTNKTGDQLSEESGFLGATETPWWIRPGIKYRGLALIGDVGGSRQSTRWINMQGDVDLVFHFNKKNTLSFITNYGYQPVPRRFQSSNEVPPPTWTSRRHYVRWIMDKGLIVYAGLLDKTYGIRHPDHTAVNRGLIGLGQSDQAHGVVVQKATEQYDVSGNIFLGNMGQEKELRQLGFAATGEYYLDKTFAAGGSVLMSENDYKIEKRYAFLSRLGFAKGKGFLFELGVYDNYSRTTVERSNRGYYNFLQGIISLSQGYNFMTTFQTFKPELSSSTGSETNQLAMGFMMFPWKKTEMRIELVNVRSIAQENTSPDQWNLQSQVYVAW